MAVAPVRVKKWTRKEWQRLIELGVFGPDDRLELLDGEIVEMSPQSPEHANVTEIVANLLRNAFGDGYRVRSQLPVALEEASEPEPDVAVFQGQLQDLRSDHPRSPVLLVEVALSSLGKDRDRKASLYARAGVPEYWIVNLDEGHLEVYRTPIRDGQGHYDGWSYGSVSRLAKGHSLSPLALPAVSLQVSALLP